MDYVIYRDKKIHLKSNKLLSRTSLNLSNLEIEDLMEIEGLEKINRLNNLNLNNNKISSLKGIEHFEFIEELYLNNNRIEKIDFIENIKIRVLDLSNNNIEKIENINTSLAVLDLSNNKIKEIKGLSGFNDLLELFLENNKITEIKGLWDCEKLNNINLNNNPISNPYERKLMHFPPQKIVEYCKNKKHKAYRLLKVEECEHVDFKVEMYKLKSSTKKVKIEAKKEFLKDIIALSNNFKKKSLGKSYLIIGVSETNKKYNGIHKNIIFDDTKILRDLVNENIKPNLISLEFIEYFISGDNTKILISRRKKEGYDRNLIIQINYKSGYVYEFKKKYGNPALNVPLYFKGLAFYRDGSQTRPILEEIRQKIRNLRKTPDSTEEKIMGKKI